MTQTVSIYDTTLRDGSQGEGVSFSLDNKLATALELDNLGIAFIEGGWPFSNKKDEDFFRLIRKENLKHAQIAAFGSTRRANSSADKDKNVLALLAAECPVVTMFGKSWDLHVTDALRVPLEENIAMVADSVSFVKSQDRTVIFDAEHFFDGYKNNPEYAMQVLKAATESGADVLCLCDTNGGCLPSQITEIVTTVKQAFDIEIGIHVHNDGGLAVANSIAAVAAGAAHVQGTINGIGERCGNADLCAIIPNLELKMNHPCLADGHLQKLTQASHAIYDIINLHRINNQAFVGQSAFAHKGGIHVNAVQKNSLTYEHVKPETVGNTRRILISELSGRSNVLAKSIKYDLAEHPETQKKILSEIVRLESEGYTFEAAEASFELLVRRLMGDDLNFFETLNHRVIVEHEADGKEVAEATVKVRVGEDVEHRVAEGDGPVDAMKKALRIGLERHYPELTDVRLVDFRVLVIPGGKGTASKVRVLIDSRDNDDIWSTVGVSESILEASWMALIESVVYKLAKTR